ncbi:unnamed protein product, partial [Arabidopsis halleri]
LNNVEAIQSKGSIRRRVVSDSALKKELRRDEMIPGMYQLCCS